jgi:hypothetical protein
MTPVTPRGTLTNCRDIKTLLNTPYIRKLLNTDDKPEEFLLFSFDLYSRFARSGDAMASSLIHVAGLLERAFVRRYHGSGVLLGWSRGYKSSNSLERTGGVWQAGDEGMGDGWAQGRKIEEVGKLDLRQRL